MNPNFKNLNFGSLLTEKNVKTIKGLKKGYRTGILYLAPANESGVINVCPSASVGCKATCLFTAGHGRYDNVRQVRINRTLFYKSNPKAFAELLSQDVASKIQKFEKSGFIPAFRINGTSDLPKLALPLAEQFPEVQFYDYTKIPKPWLRTRKNYDLTFSASETNLRETMDALANGINAAVVFSTKPGQALPDSYLGYEVISGDETDLRFLDKKGVVVGLTAKGKARKDTSGFVVQV